MAAMPNAGAPAAFDFRQTRWFW